MNITQCPAIPKPIITPKTGGLIGIRLADVEFRGLLTDAIKQCHKRFGKDRNDIAKELTERLGRSATALIGEHGLPPITESTLNEFTRALRAGQESHLPAAWLGIFCEVTDDDRPIRAVLTEHLRIAVAIGEDVLQASGPLKRAYQAVSKIAERESRKAGQTKR
jgi:hypothetical protein